MNKSATRSRMKRFQTVSGHSGRMFPWDTLQSWVQSARRLLQNGPCLRGRPAGLFFHILGWTMVGHPFIQGSHR